MESSQSSSSQGNNIPEKFIKLSKKRKKKHKNHEAGQGENHWLKEAEKKLNETRKNKSLADSFNTLIQNLLPENLSTPNPREKAIDFFPNTTYEDVIIPRYDEEDIFLEQHQRESSESCELGKRRTTREDGTILAALPTYDNIDIFADQPMAQLTNSSEHGKEKAIREDGTTLADVPTYDNIDIFADHPMAQLTSSSKHGKEKAIREDRTTLAALPKYDNIEIFADQPVGQWTNSSKHGKQKAIREDGTTLTALPTYDNIDIFADRGEQESTTIDKAETRLSTYDDAESFSRQFARVTRDERPTSSKINGETPERGGFVPPPTELPQARPGKKRTMKAREVYKDVSVNHVVKETENGTILSISIKAPKWLNYAIVNIHKETSCHCTIKDIFPLGNTQEKRNFDMNWNVSKVKKQCDIATNVSQMMDE